jgi:hypothetical protein
MMGELVGRGRVRASLLEEKDMRWTASSFEEMLQGSAMGDKSIYIKL